MSLDLIFHHDPHVYRQSLAGLGNTFIPMLSGLVEGGVRGSATLVFNALFGVACIYFVEVSAWMAAAALAMAAYYISIQKIKREQLY